MCSESFPPGFGQLNIGFALIHASPGNIFSGLLGVNIGFASFLIRSGSFPISFESFLTCLGAFRAC